MPPWACWPAAATHRSGLSTSPRCLCAARAPRAPSQPVSGRYRSMSTRRRYLTGICLAIGRQARQVHRELASGLSMPVGFKNGTNGDVQVRLRLKPDVVRTRQTATSTCRNAPQTRLHPPPPVFVRRRVSSPETVRQGRRRGPSPRRRRVPARQPARLVHVEIEVRLRSPPSPAPLP